MTGLIRFLRHLEGPQTMGRGPAFWLAFAVVLAAACAYPLFSDGYTVGNTVYFFIWVFIALSLCVIWGYGGALSFGQTAFFGIAGYSYGILTITVEGIWRAGFMVARILMLIACTLLLTYTTSPITLTDGLERLLRPLKKVGFPVHELSMIMSIALRFLPTLIQETDKIISAQKARGADFDTGGLVQKAKALIPILIPLFISSFRRAEELAVAMECRCYHGDDGRTSLRQLVMHGRDWGLVVFSLALCAGIVALRVLGL